MFVRGSEAYRGNERRRGLTAIAVILLLVYLFLTGLSTVWTDFLWFRSVGYVDVWRVHLVAGLALGAVGAVIVFLFVWGNLILTDRLSPRLELLDLGEDEELVERFREWVEPRLRLVRLAVAAVFALLLGVGVSAWREELLLFLNPTSFGVADPQFDTDLSFYLFRLPLWSQLTTWFFNVVVLTLILVAALHYLNGGIRFQRGTRLTMRSGVKAHLSGLAALLAGVRAIGYWIDTRELVYSSGDSFFGAGYTDVNARLPALNLLILVSVVAAGLFLWNIRRRDWTLAFVSIGAWAFVSIAAGLIYPAVIQRFQVDTGPLEAERTFIDRNIAATRAAYGLEEVEIRPFSANRELDVEGIEANRLTLENLRLWDPGVLRRTYQSLQEIRTYYRVDRVDTDRYVVNGVPTQVMIAPRELEEDSDSIPADWQNQRLIYTHGFGVVMSPANGVERDGQPSFLISDIPANSTIENVQVNQGRIYFGESYDPGKPVVVRTGTDPQEVDFPLEGGTEVSEYEGAAGVEIGGLLNRLAFALRYRDLNILISDQLRSDSRILMIRNIEEMVQEVAPFLYTDADPYPVIIDDRVVWLIDMYTISNRYPYSQPVLPEETLRLPRQSGLPSGGFNYIRNSVKATVDAFDGTITLYVNDPGDPVIRSWQKVHPDLFADVGEMSEELEAHLRYPQDLFKIQSEKYLDYHVRNTDDFFRRSDAWSIPRDPSTPTRSFENQTLLRGDRQTGTDPRDVDFLNRVLPNYLLLRLPGEEELSYVLMQPFTPRDKLNMSSFFVADSSPGRYGRLIDYRLPSGSLVEGTEQVGDRINQNADISQQRTLWDDEGSVVLFGDMLVVPIEDSILYVIPVYLAAEEGGLPEFRRVVAVFGDRIEWDTTLNGALSQVFDATIGGEPPPDTPPTGDGTVADLLERAARAFDQARAALQNGDLAAYQDLVEEAERLIDEAAELIEPAVEAGLHLTIG